MAHEILVSAQGPLVWGFWVLGLRVWGQGLTITRKGWCPRTGKALRFMVKVAVTGC